MSKKDERLIRLIQGLAAVQDLRFRYQLEVEIMETLGFDTSKEAK